MQSIGLGDFVYIHMQPYGIEKGTIQADSPQALHIKQGDDYVIIPYSSIKKIIKGSKS